MRTINNWSLIKSNTTLFPWNIVPPRVIPCINLGTFPIINTEEAATAYRPASNIDSAVSNKIGMWIVIDVK